MTQEDLAVLAGFAAVWERVSGERIDGMTAAALTWEDVLQGLHDHWRGCASLAVWAKGTHRKRLLGLSAEARELFRVVQTEYFLKTGDIYLPALVCNFASYTPYNLRNSCKNAMKLAEHLQKAEETCGVAVGDAWKTVSCHADTLKKLLKECLQ